MMHLLEHKTFDRNVLPNKQSKLPFCLDKTSAYVLSGQEVVYQGRVAGGPDYGEHGIIRRTYRQKAVVDMGNSGMWHIPYYFLIRNERTIGTGEFK